MTEDFKWTKSWKEMKEMGSSTECCFKQRIYLNTLKG